MHAPFVSQIASQITSANDVTAELIADMSHRYTQWLGMEGFPAMCANELLMEDGITETQRRWLNQFITAYDAVISILD